MDEWDEKTAVASDRAPVPVTRNRDRAYLVMLAGSHVGQMFNLRGSLVIGRGREADLRVRGEGISRAHARLSLRPDRLVIEDLGSTNGTFINGTKVRGQLPANDGDKIQLGTSTIFKFTYHDEIDEDFQRQMFESASIDALTGAFNKRFFIDRFNVEFRFAKRHGLPLSLILFDLDHFKKINDEYGHLAGDHVLGTFGKLILPIVRSEDVFARYGGEEFAVLCRGIDNQEAAVLAERIREQVRATDFVFEGKSIPVTVSAGLATMPNPDVVSLEDLIALADQALYDAKRAGRNRVVVYETTQQSLG